MKRLFLCMERELVVVKEHNDNYETTYHLQNMQPTCIAVDPFQKNRVYCGTFGRGLWLSDDSGDSWRPIGDSYRYFDFPKEDGILHSSITSITISSNEQVNGYGVVYVGTEPSALFRSENGGETWTELKNMKSLLSSYTWAFPPRPFTHHVRWITVDPNNPNTIHVSIEAGAVIQSNDKGHTWIDKNSVLLSMLINYLCTLKHQIAFMHHVVTDLWADLIVLILRVITMETAGSHVVQDLNIIIYTAWLLIQLIVIRFSFLPRQVLISLIIVSLMSLIFIENERYSFPASTTRTTICNRYSHFDVCYKRSRTTYVLHVK